MSTATPKLPFFANADLSESASPLIGNHVREHGIALPGPIGLQYDMVEWWRLRSTSG